MGKKFSCSLLFIAVMFAANGQQWDSIAGHIDNGFLDVIYSDTITHYLYAAGAFNKLNGKHMQGIARWNGVQWDSLETGIDGIVYATNNSYPANTESMANYNGKLYVGGNFYSLGKTIAPCLGTWDGSAWDSIPIKPFKDNYYNSVDDLEVISGKLYVGGSFDTVAALLCHGIAQWDGSTWSSINFPKLNGFYSINSICEYGGSIYAAGNFYGNVPGDTNSNILRWDGSVWHSVSGGIKGSTVDIWKMVVYKGELYVAGHFFKSDGNAGDYIQKWNGTNWKGVGGGVGNGQIENLIVYNNKLYAMGIFNSAGGVPADEIAEWDSTHWCSIGSTFNNVVNASCIYNDTLYIGGGFTTVNGKPDVFISKWMSPNYTDSCGVNTTGVDELQYSTTTSATIYPNPNNGKFILKCPAHHEKTSVEIYNVLGKKIYTTDLLSTGTEINLSEKSNGIYLYRVTSETGSLLGSGKIEIEH